MDDSPTARSSQDHTLARRAGSVALITLGVLLLAVGALTAWLRTQVLDTEQWTETSRVTLQQPAVQEAVAQWMVDTTFDRLEPGELIGDALPPRLAPLSAPIESRLQVETYGVAQKAVASPQAEAVWVGANRRAHTRFRNLIDGKAPFVVETEQGLRVDLRPLLVLVADKVGLDPKVLDRIPAGATQLRPKNAEKVERGIDLLRWLERWGAWISLLSLPLIAAGIWLARDRRRAWMWVGGSVAIAAYLIGQVREWLGPQVASAITEATTWRPAVLATWDTVTQQLGDVSTAGIIIGIGIIAMALLAGPSNAMRSARAFAAPVLVAHRWPAVGVSIVLAWLLIGSIDVLDSRRAWVKLVLVLGVAGTTWVLSRTAEREADESDTAASTEPEPEPVAPV